MFLKNCWYVAAFGDELDEESLIGRRILDVPVVLFRGQDGKAAALLDQCPHRLAPLSLGRRVADGVRCNYHGMVFAEDGRCVRIPGQTDVPKAVRTPAFPVVERHGHVWIWMGEADLANEASIPEIAWAEDPAWATVAGLLHFKADYRLLSDNLLDLSHETYLHEGTIGNVDEQTIADYPVKVTVREDGAISAGRVMREIDPPPWFAMILNTQERIDRWQTAIWAAPGFNMTDTVASSAGSDGETAFIGRILHLLTPETEFTTHYFWSVSRNYRVDDAALSDTISDAVVRTFGEDKDMLERQQLEIQRTGIKVPKMAIRIDEAPIRARRMLESRIKNEQETGFVSVAPIRLLDSADLNSGN